MVSDEHFIEVWNNLPVGIVEFDGDGSIIMSNASIARWFLPVVGENAFLNAFTLLEPLIPDLRFAIEELRWANREPRGRAVIGDVDGTKRVLHAHVRKLDTRFIGVITDITEDPAYYAR